MDPRQHVNPGDPIRLAASQINGLNKLLSPGVGVHAGPPQYQATPYTWVLAKNATGALVERWGVLAITGMDIAPSGSSGNATSQFEQLPVVTGDTPSSSTTAWCVAVEPIESGKIGRVAVSGVVQCKLSIGDSSHKFARAKASTSELETATSGEGLVLWKGSGWALVRLGIVDLTKYSGFDATKQQILSHAANGGIVWLNTTACT